MGSQIDNLLDKYWSGETTLEEEAMIKSFFQSNPTLSNDGKYFRYLQQKGELKIEGTKASTRKRTWVSAAATVTVGLITAFLVINNANKDPFALEDPEEAYEATRNALMMISAGLNEGQAHALELTKFNKAKEELQEEARSQQN